MKLWYIVFFLSSVVCADQLETVSISREHATKHGGASLELERIELHFTQKPQVTISKKESDDRGWKKECYFFSVVAAPDVVSLLQTASRVEQHYTITCDEVLKPEKGIKLCISYDPQMIRFTYDQVDTMNLKKSFVFRILDKKVLKEIESAEWPIVQLTYISQDGCQCQGLDFMLTPCGSQACAARLA